MKPYKEYIKKLNFKQYEATNCFAYELIMRNKDAQKCFLTLGRTLEKLLKTKKILLRFDELNHLTNNTEFYEYFNLRMNIDSEIQIINNIDVTFLKEMINYFIIQKGIYENSTYDTFFKNYINNPNLKIKNNPYINCTEHIQLIQDIIDESIKKGRTKNDIVFLLNTFIQISGSELLRLNYKNILNDLSIVSSDPKKALIINFYSKMLHEKLTVISREKIINIQYLTKKLNMLRNKDLEIYYLKRKKIFKKLIRYNHFREKIEHYLNYNFFIDFDKKLYLEYDFLSDTYKKIILNFYKNLPLANYPELKIHNITSHRISQNIKCNEVHFNLDETFILDNELMNNLSSIHIQEDLIHLSKLNPMQHIFRTSKIQLIYSRPTLFSERFRDISLTFNPNLSKQELNSQFNAIIDAYQSNILKNKSIYEVLEKAFNAWVDKIERPKVSKKKTSEVESRKITDLLNKVQNILYIYDANQKGICNNDICYTINESERTIQTLLYFANYLIEDGGWKLLLTSQKD